MVVDDAADALFSAAVIDIAPLDGRNGSVDFVPHRRRHRLDPRRRAAVLPVAAIQESSLTIPEP